MKYEFCSISLYMELLNYLFCDMFGGILECYELTHVRPQPDPPGSHA